MPALRVLFSCRPAYGHYTPLVGVARALQRAGHQVRFATAAPLDSVIRNDGFDVDAAGLTEREIRDARRRNPEWARTAGIPQLDRMRAFTKSFATFEVPPRVSELREIVRRLRVDLVIHEMSEFAAPLAGALEEVPVVNHSFGPMIEADVMAAASTAAAVHWKTNGLPAPDRAGMYGLLYLDITPPTLQFPHIATVGRVHALRPTPFRPAHAQPAPWLLALGHRPLVAVTFGTVFNDRLELYRAVIDGLAGADLDVVVAAGRSPVTTNLGRLPSNVQVHDWVPWADLLARSTVVVTHGGASSTLDPLGFGVPIVMIPLSADHFTNARMARPSGAAVILDAETATSNRIRESVEAAMDEPMRNAARRISDEISGLPSPDEVVPVLARLGKGSV